MEKLIENLKKRGYQVQAFETGAQAVDYLAQSIRNTVVGIGGSATVAQLGLYDRLAENNRVLWHAKDPSVTKQASFESNVYITSVNAIAETGDMVNIDGRTNRVAGSVFGKDEVYIIVGKNKLTPDLDAAVFRARNVAAPQNAQRLGRKTPCAAKADKCYDCSSPERICNNMLIQMRPSSGVGKTEVILIGEDLGM